MRLYLFNPDHDMALAHGSNHYVAPDSALKFASDAASLPVWVAEQGRVLVDQLPDADFLDLCRRLDLKAQFTLLTELDTTQVDEIVPWGWNWNVVNRLDKNGLPKSVLPTVEILDAFRRLAHRRTAAHLAEFVRHRYSQAHSLPSMAEELCDMAALERYVQEHQAAVLKMPWSGSGRGIRRVAHPLNQHQYGWAVHSIRRYGCVMAEPLYPVIQDFAMEFVCDEAGVRFVGYSLFYTHNGIYQHNLLLSDKKILQALSAYVSVEHLAELQELVQGFLQQTLFPVYRGCIGVDMFIYQEGDHYGINPYVEINLRMTMGYLAHQIVQRHLADDASGVMRMRYLPGHRALLEEHHRLSVQSPLVLEKGKMAHGYCSLTPVSPDTQYAVQLLLD